MERRKDKLGGAEHGHLEPIAASVLVNCQSQVVPHQAGPRSASYI